MKTTVNLVVGYQKPNLKTIYILENTYKEVVRPTLPIPNIALVFYFFFFDVCIP